MMKANGFHAVAGLYASAGDNVGAQSAAVHQATQHSGAREPLQVRARLAAAPAEEPPQPLEAASLLFTGAISPLLPRIVSRGQL